MNDRALSAQGARWAIATPHWAATDAGAAAFEAGGNAVDAAVGAAVTLAAVYPHMCGVGGDLFALVASPDGSVTAVNGSGAAPATADPDALRQRSALMPEVGPATITVPGAASGWAALAERGRLDLREAFGAAIAFAEDGIAVADDLAGSMAFRTEQLSEDPGLRGVFLRDGQPLTEGDLLVQPALARTLKTLRDEGPAALYGGDVGARYASGLQAAGSPMTLDDLAAHSAEITEPLQGGFRDIEVLVTPPNSQGFVLLEMLAALQLLGVDPDPLGPDAALMSELFRLASADRDRYLADPRRAHVPVDTLLSEAHVRHLCEEAQTWTSTPGPLRRRPAASGDTVALVAADAEGNAISLVQSLYNGFGAGILEPSTGMIAHNRGSLFSLDPASPNLLEGGKRPFHTLTPVLARRDGRLVAVSGSMGGGAQPQINAQLLIRSFELGMTPADAVAAPRWAVGGTEPDASLRFVEVETAVPGATCRALEEAGYALDRLPEGDGVGHAHMIRVLEDGFEVATDPRADGSARAG